MPNFVHEKIHHYADTYGDCLKLAKENSTAAVTNQHSLQYFALDVYSRKMTKWGCVGEVEEHTDDDDGDDHSGHSHGSSSASATAAAATTTTASAASQAAAPTSAASTSSDCHTHADGSVHCGTH